MLYGSPSGRGSRGSVATRVYHGTFHGMPLRSLAMRLVVALVTSLSLLHLTLAGNGVVCASGPVASTHGTMAMSGAGSPAGANTAMASFAREQSDVAQHSDHRAPAQERCCDSMSSCGVATLAGVVER